MLVSDVSMMIERHLEAYRIALPVLEKQEKGNDDCMYRSKEKMQ